MASGEFVLGGIAVTLWLAWRDPGLLKERMAGPFQKGHAPVPGIGAPPGQLQENETMNEPSEAQKKATAKVAKRLDRTNLDSKHERDPLHANYELDELDVFDKVRELIRAVRAIRAH